jgi:hypothetical protein
MPTNMSRTNSVFRMRVGSKVWGFVGLSYDNNNDVYVNPGGVDFKQAAPYAGIDKARQAIGIADIETVQTLGLFSDHTAPGHTLIDCGAFDVRYDYPSQKMKLFKIGRTSAPATVPGDTELVNDSSINAAGSIRPLLIIGVGEGASVDNLGVF